MGMATVVFTHGQAMWQAGWVDRLTKWPSLAGGMSQPASRPIDLPTSPPALPIPKTYPKVVLPTKINVMGMASVVFTHGQAISQAGWVDD
jgi:hypothetical protein